MSKPTLILCQNQKNELSKYIHAKDNATIFQFITEDTIGYHGALIHAPILWFAPTEEYFPTIPFFSAFDGINNNKQDGLDFEDPQEIAVIDSSNPDYPDKISWDGLRAFYEDIPIPERKQHIYVFFEKERKNIQSNRILSKLMSDEQFKKRYEKKYKKIFTGKCNIYKYYFYYIKDEGLEGHPEDIEWIFVFAPEKYDIVNTDSCYGIIAGAGHSAQVPNNVLVYDQKNICKIKKSLGYHIPILVELGGHSTAPDLDNNGLFNLGSDVNWHVENVWGTRDIQSISGRGAVGQYEPWMTFQRDPEDRVYPQDELKLYPQEDLFVSEKTTYHLIPLSWLKRFYQQLSNLNKFTKRQSTEKSHRAFLTEVNKFSHFFKDSLQFSELSFMTINRFALWNAECFYSIKGDTKAKYKINPPEKHIIWRHKEYKNHPDLIFKPHLFRPTNWKTLYLGFSLHRIQESTPKSELRMTYIFPVFKTLPMKISGILELQQGIYYEAPIGKNSSFNQWGFERRYSTSIYYDRFYAGNFSFYGYYSYRYAKKELPGHFLGGGLSMSMNICQTSYFRYFQTRIGLRSQIDHKSYDLAPFQMEIQFIMHH